MSRPRAALGILREAAADGRLDALCAEHGVRLLTVFGSAVDLEADDPKDLDRAGPVAREAGLTQCEPLFEAEEFLFTHHQLRAIQERLDTAWLREIELRRLAGDAIS